MAHSAIMHVMVQAAIKAGRSLVRDYGEVQNLQVSLKGPAHYVGKAGRKAEKIIFTDLMKARPKFSFLMKKNEEITGVDPQHRFIINPLDGTTNFLHGIPFFSVSIALERQGQIVAAVIYNPVFDELFTAERGNGVFYNDRRCRVAARRKLEDCMIATAIPHLGSPQHGQYLIELRNVMVEVAGVRSLGAASLDLAYVAAGRTDGLWINNLTIWDMATGILMVREAGGFITDKEGKNDIFCAKNIVAGNEFVQAELRKILKKGI
ncbi:inositol monophosphatase family protein [Bartonella sp. A05]|uniref:inositol monophosphatase family protein n=1 Tax=Bartonella sp. A05 TaxID=2967261 RepID=UPI0022A9F511|nr:inositol monophosphatase family protein [Bartonella sp. A05]MCZ2203666.1 inositol monophosphatase [Bartonella sp. A05]